MKTILIIEDNRVIANVYRAKLTMEGFKVEVEHDGEAGLAAVERVKPDAVLLDLMLPKLHGLEVLQRIRALPDGPKLPILVFSNSYTSERTDEVWQAGATQVLVKANSSPKQVVSAIRAALDADQG